MSKLLISEYLLARQSGTQIQATCWPVPFYLFLKDCLTLQVVVDQYRGFGENIMTFFCLVPKTAFRVLFP